MPTRDTPRAATAQPGSAHRDPGLVLKTSPPRLPRDLVARTRLSLDTPRFADACLVIVQAPAGFGKTSLLGQWRREMLAQGAAAAWLTLDELDEVPRIVQGLFASISAAGEHRAFRRGLEQWAPGESELAQLTVWLASIAETAIETLLILDDVDSAPPTATVQTLLYVLRNAPANLRIVLSARAPLEPQFLDVAGHAQTVTLGVEELRFTLEETSSWLASTVGARVDADSAVRLHELTEGWPLGLKLAVATVGERGDVGAAIAQISARSRSFERYFVESLIGALPAPQVELLVRCAAADMVHGDLAIALAGGKQVDNEDVPRILASLARSTPIFIESSQPGWMRIHPLARQFLLDRFAGLPSQEQRDVHRAAVRWLADHEMFEEAARHALRAREDALAWDLAERSLYDVVRSGDSPRVLEWLERLPAQEIARRPRLRLATAWSLAMGERHAAANELVAPMIEGTQATVEDRFEGTMIASTICYFADDVDRGLDLIRPWLEHPPTQDTFLLAVLANQRATFALLGGAPETARLWLSQRPRYDGWRPYDYLNGFSEWIFGATYLWEGQAALAEEALLPHVRAAQEESGRRSPVAVLLASGLAMAHWECDHIDEAEFVLANRLDAVERLAAPEGIVMGYVCAARIAHLRGDERRAIDLMETLYALGEARRMPRLRIASLAEQIRVHAHRGRVETCLALSQRLSQSEPPKGMRAGMTASIVGLAADIAHAYSAIAARNWTNALEILDGASAIAERLRRGRDGVQIRMLRALAMRNLGRDGLSLLKESISLAQTMGLARIALDTHPAIVDWIGQLQAGESDAALQAPASRAAAVQPRAAYRRSAGPGILTPKERSVLQLLARGMSNKQIALALDVSDETVKWHLKNLFGKLNAGARDHLVNRARMLGLIE